MGQGNVVDESLPTPAQLAEADECEIFDKDSKPLKFSSIRFSSKTTIVLFVRHWGCGLCSGYLDEVTRKFKPLFEEGSEESKRIQLVVIGHGGPEGIERYRKFAGNIKCEIYADPEKKLYKALGIVNQLKEMGIGPKHKRSGSTLWMVLASAYESLTAGSLRSKQGAVMQLGADFIFHPSGEPYFAHRMITGRDRSEYALLAEKAGFEVAKD